MDLSSSTDAEVLEGKSPAFFEPWCTVDAQCMLTRWINENILMFIHSHIQSLTSHHCTMELWKTRDFNFINMILLVLKSNSKIKIFYTQKFKQYFKS